MESHHSRAIIAFEISKIALACAIALPISDAIIPKCRKSIAHNYGTLAIT